MLRFIKKTLRLGFLTCLLILLGMMVALAVSITPKWGDYLFHVEVVTQHGDEVNISMPLSVLDTGFTLMPSEIKALCRELDLDAATIAEELRSTDGEDIVSIQGAESIRIYVSSSQVASRGFIKVYVKENQPQGNQFNIWIPRGLVAFTAHLVNWSGVIDHYVELPPEIRNLKVVKSIETSALSAD